MKSKAIFGFLFLFLVATTPAYPAGVPLDAQRHMARGAAAMQLAKTPADFRDAVKEFREATKLAPGWADAWFNLGVAQESAEDYAGAMRSFKAYLEKSPDAPDRQAVQTRIFGLEYLQEKQAQPDSNDTARRAGGRDIAGADAPNFSGVWRWHSPEGHRDYALEISGQRTATGNCIDEVGSLTRAYPELKCRTANEPMYFHGTAIEDGFKAQWSPISMGPCSHINEKLPIEGRVSPDGMNLTVTYQYESFVQSRNTCIPSRLRGQRNTITWTLVR